jgi:hypothetical protein
VDAVVARLAEPHAPTEHLCDGEPLEEPPLAVAVAREEVVERQE